MKTRNMLVNKLYASMSLLLFGIVGFLLVARILFRPYAHILGWIADEKLLYLILAGAVVISFTISISLLIAGNPAMHKFFGDGETIITKESLLYYVNYLVMGCFLGFAYLNLFFLFTSIILNNG